MARRVLVVGATGALRPAVLGLADAGEHVYALARDESRLEALAAQCAGRISPVPVDYQDQSALTKQLHLATRDGRFDAAVLYCPTAPPDAMRQFAAAVDGRVVVLATSEVARPRDRDEFALAAEGAVPNPRLVLGWANDPDGARWHTPEEISAAALDVLASGREQLLGTVRPWHERPDRTR